MKKNASKKKKPEEVQENLQIRTQEVGRLQTEAWTQAEVNTHLHGGLGYTVFTSSSPPREPSPRHTGKKQ